MFTMAKKRTFSEAIVSATKSNTDQAAPIPTASEVLVEATLKSAVDALLQDTLKHAKKREKRAVTNSQAPDDLLSEDNNVTLVVTFKEPPYKQKLRPQPM